MEDFASKLHQLGQFRLAARISKRDETARQLAEQAATVDWDLMAKLFQARSAAEENLSEVALKATSPPSIRLPDRRNAAQVAAAKQVGTEILAAGQVGVILVAGGQGTRLGFDAPKGMFPVGPVSNATLFQILLEKIVAVGQRHGRTPPLYVMTSDATHGQTVRYLGDQQNFGLQEDRVTVFRQASLPALDMETGEALLESPQRLSFSPDGHGGLAAALLRSEAFEHMRSRGLKYLFYMQVDNPLATVCDAEFLGYHLLQGSQMSTQVVAKQAPSDKVGVVVSMDGRTRILEYSDLPAEAAERRDASGNLALWAGNIAVHVIDVDFLAAAAANASALPFHIARKAVPFVNENGEFIKPSQANALKFERFIFDLLPQAKHALVMEVEAGEAFKPLKNASGSPADTPEHVRSAISNQARCWLTELGIDAEGPVEISPLYAVDREALALRRSELSKKLPAGTYLRP